MSLPDQSAVAAQLAAFDTELGQARTPRDAQAVRDRFLGRKNSVVASWMQLIGTASPDEKRAIGRWANELKQAVEARWSAYQAQSEQQARPAGAIDVTLPGRAPALGHKHPLTLVRDRMEGIFTRMGFAVVEGPEIEDEWHCFDALNMPAEHPARDMQDTLYLGTPLQGETGRADDRRTMLRTHTSSIQIRYMQAHQPPIRIVAPGRVYRRDDLDLTHTPMFTQMEGLAVGEGISLADLKGTLTAFAREMFSPRARVRFRSSFFPYTEPSAEVDISCWQCDGAGCPMCKRTGWIEIGGSGMVHPAVFEAVGYDPDRYTGFAFGIGIERVAILRHQVQDIRLFFENDLRFLEQFPDRAPPMRLLLSWVRDFVPVTATPQAIADTMALRGFEVAAVEPAPDGVRPPWPQHGDGPDAVIDFEVTANRPDCLSVVGFAREIATAFDLPFYAPAVPTPAPGVSSDVRVDIEDAVRCPRYAAAVVDVRATQSPLWMTARLQAAGVRPISPFVDITNYVLMELGHPMHAFDEACLDGHQIRVRCATPKETLVTLDGVTRTLDAEMLVIADATRAQAIAGVMGGAGSEVSAATKRIVFESACFQPSSVRRTSRKLGLKTEASARFERGADVNAPGMALARALDLVARLGAGAPRGGAVDVYPSPRAPRVVALRRDRIRRLLGLDVPDAGVARILRSLGLEVTDTADGWSVTIPTFRVDLLREVDLIEEVGRHHGLDKLDSSFPTMTAAAPAPDARVLRDRMLRDLATAAGLTEAVTFGFIERAAARLFVEASAEADIVPVANPLSATFDVLRPSLLPGLVDVVAHNRRHGRRDVAIFEIGARFTVPAGERRALAIAWTGAAAPEHWSGSGRDVDFFDLKGVVERLARALGVDLHLEPVTVPWLVAGQSARVLSGGDPARRVALGTMGVLTPKLVEQRGAPKADKIVVAELDLDALTSLGGSRDEMVRPLPRFPSVVRDLSIVVPERLSAASIRGTIQAAAADGPAPLVSVAFFDRYKGKGVADDAVSVSVRLTFQAADRTLTDADVQQSFDRALAALVREHGAVQR